MPLQIIKDDIVSMAADAIVYAETPQPFTLFSFNPLLIHKTGKEILKTREDLKPIIIGQAKIAPATLLDCKYIIHTSAPAWHGGGYHELSQLETCYERVFQLAVEYNCKTIAMPIIAADKLGYPKALSQKTALQCIRQFLEEHNDYTVTLVLPNKTAIMLPGNQYTDVMKCFDKHLVKKAQKGSSPAQECSDSKPASAPSPAQIEAFLAALTEQMKAKSLSEKELSKKANLFSASFNEMMSGCSDSLSKNRVLALAMALELPLDELKSFIATCGYSLEKDNKFDLIIDYCISKNMYDLYDLNQILFRFEQELL